MDVPHKIIDVVKKQKKDIGKCIDLVEIIRKQKDFKTH